MLTSKLIVDISFCKRCYLLPLLLYYCQFFENGCENNVWKMCNADWKTSVCSL